MQKQRQQNSARAGGEHAEKDATGPEHCRHGKPEQDHRGQAEISEIVFQAAPQHLHDIRRAGDVNMKVARVQLMNDPQKARHRFLGHAAFHKDDDVAGLAVFGDEQSAPEGTLQRVFKTLRPFSQALHRAHRPDGMDLLGEFLDALQISRRRNVARRHRQNDLRLRREMLVDLFGLLEPGIAGRKEKILFHDRLEIDKGRDEREQHARDYEHPPMPAPRYEFATDQVHHPNHRPALAARTSRKVSLPV